MPDDKEKKPEHHHGHEHEAPKQPVAPKPLSEPKPPIVDPDPPA